MDSLIQFLFSASFYLILISMLMSFIRLIIGPTVADRVVALDSMTIVSISIIVYLALFYQRSIYLDVALVYGLLSFMGVVAVARYIEGGLK
ncbi:MAG: cation:proton antiporter [Bacteroidetes bacterium 4572_77]|nr:MAG: cation:proton antiporter [Bacteroidetes bacterium 4572_77]